MNKEEEKIAEFRDFAKREDTSAEIIYILGNWATMAAMRNDINSLLNECEEWINRLDEAIGELKPRRSIGIMRHTVKYQMFISRDGRMVQFMGLKEVSPSRKIIHEMYDFERKRTYYVDDNGTLTCGSLVFETEENASDIMKHYDYPVKKQRKTSEDDE